MNKAVYDVYIDNRAGQKKFLERVGGTRAEVRQRVRDKYGKTAYLNFIHYF